MTARQCFSHPWLKAACAEVNVSLPTHNHAATLAQDMVPPSNWNPDRRNSLGKAPTSPSLMARANKTPGSPALLSRDQPPELTTTQEVDMQQEGVEGKAVSAVSPHPATTSASSHSDDLLTKTIEEIGIDTTKYSMAEKHGKDSSPSSKRQSVEIPVKKAKCNDSSEMEKADSPRMEEAQLERLSAPVANGNSVSSNTDEPSVTESVLSDSATEVPPASVHPNPPSETGSL